MSHQSSATTARDVEVTRIPSGEKITLPAGTEVVITQALGGSFTILVPSQAGLYRIEGQDADSIGQEASAGSERPADGDLEQAAWNQLKTCYDPEIPVNIVDLGPGLRSRHQGPPGGRQRSQCSDDTHRSRLRHGSDHCQRGATKILTIDGVTDANVDLVWDPPWTPDRISEEGKQKLGMV